MVSTPNETTIEQREEKVNSFISNKADETFSEPKEKEKELLNPFKNNDTENTSYIVSVIFKNQTTGNTANRVNIIVK